MHSNDDDARTGDERHPLRHPRVLVPVGAIGAALTVVPTTVAARGLLLQSSSASQICSGPIPGYLEGFLQVTMLLGLLGLVAVWQADTLVGMLTMDPVQKRRLKQHKRSAAKAAVVLLLLGPVFAVLVDVMGLAGLDQCFGFTSLTP